MKQLKMIVGSKPSDEWRTPPALFDAVERSFGTRWVDMAATAENSLCQAFVGPGSGLGNNALVEDWEYLWRTLGPLWCNPPYSQPLLAQFVYRFLGARVDAVMPIIAPAAIQFEVDTARWDKLAKLVVFPADGPHACFVGTQ